ncbi:MAG: hypothetical protein HC877_18850 [Thioploca sp.]|nr:hypothetical protein [Thioploca sp.]
MNKPGIKFDNDKIRFDLIPFDVLQEVAKVFTFGANKYSVDNWKNVENYKDRYFAAVMRHLASWRMNELKDKESKLYHLAHAATCIFFLLWFDMKNKNESNKTSI